MSRIELGSYLWLNHPGEGEGAMKSYQGFEQGGEGCRTLVLNLWVMIPLGGSNDPFTGATSQMSYISDIYIMIHNSSKITVMK